MPKLPLLSLRTRLALLIDDLRAAIRAHRANLVHELAEESRPRAQFPAWTRQRYAERRGEAREQLRPLRRGVSRLDRIVFDP